MTRFLLASFALLFYRDTFAAIEKPTQSYNLQMELSIDGKKVAEPLLVVLEGTKASIAQRYQGSKNGSFIEVVATEESETREGGLLMSFVVGTIDSEGKRKIIGAPKIMTKEAEKAEIAVNSQAGNDDYSLSVVFHRRGSDGD